jgi:predicted O-methyltransferase YrrM
MTEKLWAAVDAYIAPVVRADDEVLRNALERSEAAGLPDIQVSAPQGKLLMLLARMCGATRILEIGTLGGYSTIWLARALPAGGHLVSLEVDEAHAAVARANLAVAAPPATVEVRVGPALDTLPALARERGGPFDLVFIDADKPSNPEYLEWAIRLSRPGTAIIVDNVVRNGKIIDQASDEPSLVGTRRLFNMLSADSRVDATVIQTVGMKGYDGFVLALVKEATAG